VIEGWKTFTMTILVEMLWVRSLLFTFSMFNGSLHTRHTPPSGTEDTFVPSHFGGCTFRGNSTLTESRTGLIADAVVNGRTHARDPHTKGAYPRFPP